MKKIIIDFVNLPRKLNKEKIKKAIAKKIISKEKTIIEIIFVSPKKIHQLNKKYRKVDKPTTVLAFPQIKSPNLNFNPLGTVVLCLPEIKKEIKTGENLEIKVTELIKHGFSNIL